MTDGKERSISPEATQKVSASASMAENGMIDRKDQ